MNRIIQLQADIDVASSQRPATDRLFELWQDAKDDSDFFLNLILDDKDLTKIEVLQSAAVSYGLSGEGSHLELCLRLQAYYARIYQELVTPASRCPGSRRITPLTSPRQHAEVDLLTGSDESFLPAFIPCLIPGTPDRAQYFYNHGHPEPDFLTGLVVLGEPDYLTG